jgi:DNA-directed RNA polymerase subunit beta
MYQNHFLQNVKYYSETKKSRKISIDSGQIKIPNLLEIQYISFLYFLKFGLKEELERHNVWIQPSCFEYTYYPQRLYFEIPSQTYQETIRLGGSFGVQVILPRSFYDYRNHKIYFEWVALGTLPLITRQGHFLVNGLTCTCVAQIVRGAGIYVNKKVESDGKVNFYIDIVPERGSWVRLEKDCDGQVWIRIRNEPYLPIWSILQTMGLLSFSSYFFSVKRKKKKEKRKSINKNLKFNRSFSNFIFLKKNKRKIKKRYRKYSLHLTSNLFQRKKAKLSFIVRKFSSLWNYDLGKIGRQRLNQRFQQILPNSFRCLVPTDFIRALKELNKFNHGKITIRKFDDVDSLINRRVRVVGDLLQRETINAIKRLKRRTRQQFESLPPDQRWNIIQLISNQPFDQTFRHFALNHPLLQFADQLNPLSDLTQKRRLTGLGPGGLNLSNRKIEVRIIHPSHFSCLCPVETPEGQNAGIVNSPTLIRRLSQDNRLQSLLTVRQDGWVQIDLDKFPFKPKISLWISQKRDVWVRRFANGLLSDALGQIKLREFLKFIDINIGEFSLISRDQVNLVSIGPEQILALGPNLIPFLEHNDRNRVLIGANMLRQALPTLKVSVPRVSSKLYIYCRNDSNQNVCSRWSGFVSYVSTQRILVQSQISEYSIVRYHQVISKKKKNIIFRFFLLKNRNYTFCIEYRLGGTFRSNQSTWRSHQPYVKEGNWVERGDLLADGKASLHGNLAVGQNLLLCYIPWDGLNFEDAIVGSEALKTKDVFTSTHVEEWERKLQQSSNKIEVFMPFSIEIVRQIRGKQYEFYSMNSSSYKKRKFKRFSYKKKIQIIVKRNFLKKKKSRIFSSIYQITNYKNIFFFQKKNIIKFFTKSFNRKYFMYFLINNKFFYPENITEFIKEKKILHFFFPGYKNLDHRGLVKVGTWIEPNQILAFRIRPMITQVLTPYERLLFDILEQKPPTIQNTSLCVPKKRNGRILNVETFSNNTNKLNISYRKKQLENLTIPNFFPKKKEIHIHFSFLAKKKKEIDI